MKKNIIIVIILTISLFLLSSCKKDNRIEIKCEETGIDVLYAGIAYDIDDFILVDNIDNYKAISGKIHIGEGFYKYYLFPLYISASYKPFELSFMDIYLVIKGYAV